MDNIVQKNVGNITIKYRESDWNIQKDKKFNFKTMFCLVIIMIGLMIAIVSIATLLEDKLPFAVLMILIIITILAFVVFIIWYSVKFAYRNQIPAFSTISWLCRTHDIEAGYFNNRLLFIFKGNGQDTPQSLKGILCDIEIDGDVHHNANKLEPIRVIFDFSDATRYDIYVVNETNSEVKKGEI